MPRGHISGLFGSFRGCAPRWAPMALMRRRWTRSRQASRPGAPGPQGSGSATARERLRLVHRSAWRNRSENRAEGSRPCFFGGERGPIETPFDDFGPISSPDSGPFPFSKRFRKVNSRTLGPELATWQMCRQRLAGKVSCGSRGRSSGERRTSRTEAWVRFPPSAPGQGSGFSAASALLLATIAPTSWKQSSANFAQRGTLGSSRPEEMVTWHTKIAHMVDAPHPTRLVPYPCDVTRGGGPKTLRSPSGHQAKGKARDRSRGA